MKVFVTPPNTNLELDQLGDGFYCLAQYFNTNEDYKKYALEQKKKGRFIILDSGVGNEGVVVSKEELFEITEELKPNEVIPTDVLYDAYRTMDNTLWFINKMKKKRIENVEIFACPQGKNLQDYLMCYDFFVGREEIHTIGWSKKALPYVIYGSKNGKDQNIKEARNKFFEEYLTPSRSIKPIHCLGMGDPTEFFMYKNSPYMRSTDSCYPILAAINGINLWETKEFYRIPTPKNYFDILMNKEQIELASLNIAYVKECCKQCI